MVWRRSLPGFDRGVFAFMRSYYPDEANILAIDGAKVHLSPGGLLTLLSANVHVVAEPSKISHVLQALDSPSAFGRYQPKVRARVRESALHCQGEGRDLLL